MGAIDAWSAHDEGKGPMGIVFFCQSCGARFEVDPRMAGKKGRCKRCGQAMSIPRAEEIASMVAMPCLAGAAVGAGVSPGVGAGDGGSSIGAWLKGAEISKVALAPLTVNRMPLFKKKPDPLDDAEDSKPYVLAKPLVENRGRVRVQDNVVVRVWRRQLGGVQKLFRRINETAYLVSVPFLMILLLGAAVRNRPMALFGATVVVLLNLGRLISGIANLSVVPFRDGINLNKMKKPIRRVVEPVLTIGLVVLAFTFIPWLSSGKSAKGSVGDRIRSGAKALEKDIKSEVEKVTEKAKNLDLEKLGTQAQEKLERLGSPSESVPGNGIVIERWDRHTGGFQANPRAHQGCWQARPRDDQRGKETALNRPEPVPSRLERRSEPARAPYDYVPDPRRAAG